MPDRLMPPGFISVAESIVSWHRLPVRRYLFAAGCVGAACVVRYALWPVFGDTLFFTAFFPAVGLAAVVGGLLPGLLAVVLSDLLVWYAFIPPYFELVLSPREGVPLVTFLVLGTALVALASFTRQMLFVLVQQRDAILEERAKKERHQELLIGELDHRIRNIFGLVDGLALQTFRVEQPLNEAVAAFRARLAAMATVSTSPLGRGRSLHELIEQQLGAHASQVDVNHCETVQLTPNGTQQLALMLHELATNAIKYGALSTPAGRVKAICEISGEEGERRFTFRWIESGGPEVTPPKRQGFGTSILKNSAEYAGAEVSIDYAPQGLRYVFSTKLSNLALEPSPAS